jgi:CO/xanthine dehydrogenase Mo-binding subunit
MADAIRESHLRKTDLSAIGRYSPPDCTVEQTTGQGKAYYGYSFATDIAEVEVDTRTGHVEVLSLAAIHDSGTIINPLTAASQLEGGVAQGIGLAVTEKYLAPGGRVATGDLSTYLVPTSLDVCEEIVSDFVECPSKDGPYGAKGLGEPAIIPVAAAIANAVSNALGIRVTGLPIDRESLSKRG